MKILPEAHPELRKAEQCQNEENRSVVNLFHVTNKPLENSRIWTNAAKA